MGREALRNLAFQSHFLHGFGDCVATGGFHGVVVLQSIGDLIAAIDLVRFVVNLLHIVMNSPAPVPPFSGR